MTTNNLLHGGMWSGKSVKTTNGVFKEAMCQRRCCVFRMWWEKSFTSSFSFFFESLCVLFNCVSQSERAVKICLMGFRFKYILIQRPFKGNTRVAFLETKQHFCGKTMQKLTTCCSHIPSNIPTHHSKCRLSRSISLFYWAVIQSPYSADV